MGTKILISRIREPRSTNIGHRAQRVYLFISPSVGRCSPLAIKFNFSAGILIVIMLVFDEHVSNPAYESLSDAKMILD